MTHPLHLTTDVSFNEITGDHVRQAAKEEIARAETALRELENAEPTYSATFDALERATEQLDFAAAVAGHLEATGNLDVQKAIAEVQPAVAGFYSQIPLRPALYAALKRFAETNEAKAISKVKARFVKNTLDEFRRSGAELSADKRVRAQQIDVELAELTLQFSISVVQATGKPFWHFADTSRLSGLPDSALGAAMAAAKERNLDGYVLTLQAPSYVPAMTYLDDAELRKEMYLAYNTRATVAPDDNRPRLSRILELRKEKAALLGYAHFADLVLENRMAKSAKTALSFLERVATQARPAFEREHEELSAFAKQSLGRTTALEPWDVGYIAEKQRKALYDFDDEALRPYFSLDRVLAGLFEIATSLYGITVAEAPGKEVWHPEVKRFEMRENGEVIGVFYMDLFPRDAKRDGAWMHGLVERVPGRSEFHKSVGMVVGNMTRPVGEGKPALLTHREVQTLFHEFGHLLHHMLSNVPVRSLAGAKVAWDFVELPSQIMENWTWEEEALAKFAQHHETGNPIPTDLVAKMKRARGYRAASATMRQVSFAMLDLLIHTSFDSSRDGDLSVFARTTLQRYSATKLPDQFSFLTAFSHLFSSAVGYAAGYYSYLWAEVLDADAFGRFKDEGILNPATGAAFRSTVLERGDSEDPAILFRSFRGREPDEGAALRRVGLAK